MLTFTDKLLLSNGLEVIYKFGQKNFSSCTSSVKVPDNNELVRSITAIETPESKPITLSLDVEMENGNDLDNTLAANEKVAATPSKLCNCLM